MATYQDMQDRIALELARNDLTVPIQNEIISAIEYYQSNRFYFNETRTITFNTVASQEFYTSTDIIGLLTVQEIDQVTITVNGNRFEVHRFPYEELEYVSVTTTTLGQPNYYAFYQQQIRLYPIPIQVYAVRISALVEVAIPTTGTDSNAWTNDAEELIRARAKRKVCLNYLKDVDQASIEAENEKEALNSLIYLTNRLVSSNQIVGSM